MDSQNIRFRNVAFDTTSTWGVGVAVSLVASGMDAITNNDLLLLAHGLSHAAGYYTTTTQPLDYGKQNIINIKRHAINQQNQ